MKIIESLNIPKANGHYSQCIEHNGILYISGQLPINQETKKIPKSIEGQTDLVLKKVETILNEANSKKNNVLTVRIYISNIELWDKVNSRYCIFFKSHKPVRCIVPTRNLHYDCLIEIEATASIDL